MVSGIYWSRGRRAQNEDSLALEEVRTNDGVVCMAVVADGISTLDYGEICSGYVVECMVKWFYSYGIHMRNTSGRRIRRSLSHALYDCHSELRDSSVKENVQWGATCSLICIWGKRYVAMNVGDSCICLMDKKMHGEKGIVKIIPPDVNDRGEITKAVCSRRFSSPSFKIGRLSGKGAVLVASDGFIRKMNNNELAEALTIRGKITPERIEHRLASIGNTNERMGENDNQSAILIVRGQERRWA